MIAKTVAGVSALRWALHLLGLLSATAAVAQQLQQTLHQQLAASGSLTFLAESASLTSAGNNSNHQPSNQQQESTASNLYLSAQASKLRVNVSNICEKNHMRVTIRLSRPFYGLIHTKDKRRKPACTLEGTGEQTYTMEISYTLVQSEAAYCGVVSHQLTPGALPPGNRQLQPQSPPQQVANLSNQQQQTLSVALVVRLHKTIEFSDDRYFLLSCANRCSRADCSTRDDQTGSSRANAGRSIVTSESIATPVRTGIGGHLVAPEQVNKSSNRLLGGGEPVNEWNTERCDIMLDLKFQWLVKLCWILSILLLLTFCTAYYLCLSLNSAKIRSKQLQNRHSHRKTATLNKSASKQILYPQQSATQSESMSWSAATNSTSDELLEKIRDDNSYLAKQHQQLMLANMLVKSQPPLDQAPDLSQQQQQQQQNICAMLDTTSGVERPVILGRSAADLYTMSQVGDNQRRQLEARVKRRRSIGGSKGPVELTSHGYLKDASCKLDASQRAKSRSQTTIHYDQRQDPFETVPFSYLNNGYLSDSATSQRDYLAPSSTGLGVCYGQQMHQANELQAQFNNAQNPLLTEAYPHSGDHGMLNKRSDGVCRPQRWINVKQPYVAPLRPEQVNTIGGHINHQQQQQPQPQQITSQFDPKNSRHLIDMIQHKHRQQIAQANRTAASMQDIHHLSQPTLNRSVLAPTQRAWR